MQKRKSQFREFIKGMEKKTVADCTTFKNECVEVVYDVMLSFAYGSVYEDCLVTVAIEGEQVYCDGAKQTQFSELRAIYKNLFQPLTA